jgi:hypothetical protein
MRLSPLHSCLPVLLALCVATSCGGGRPDPQKDTLARERAAALFGDHKDLARAELAPLVARRDAVVSDLVTAAAIELVDGKTQACATFLDRAEKADPKSAGAAYLRGQISREQGDYAAALPHFRRAHELAPNDLPSRLCLAEALEETGDVKGAEELYRSVVDVGLENGLLWYATAVFRMARLLTTNKRAAEAEPFNRLWGDLTLRGASAPDFPTMALGELAKVRPPRPAGSSPAKPQARLELEGARTVLPELAGARELFPWDLDGDLQPDLTAIGERGVCVGLRREKGWLAQTVVAGPVQLVRALDIDNDGDLDLLVLQDGVLALYLCDRETWTRSPLAFPALPSPPHDIVPVDYDHEGDMDLLLVGDFGARIWRNDGAATPDEKHGFVDASELAGLPRDRTFDWAVTEDFDCDNDVDFLLGGRTTDLYLADSLRAGKFQDKTRVFPSGTRIQRKPIAADLDGDARPDLWTPEAVWHQEKDGTFRRVARSSKLPEDAWGAQALDIDLDGSLDLVWRGGSPDDATALLAAGLPQETQVGIGSGASGAPGPFALADFNGDKSVDLAIGTASGIAIRDGQPSGNRAVRLSYRGARSNRRAVGAIVEYRAGGVYRRIYWRGEPVLAGVGPAGKLDVLRITWPNGIVQTDLDLDLKAQGGVDDPDAAFKSITEAPKLPGSCPFLYSWNGERSVFVTDVLGGTPLGLPARPGVLVPFRHDEYVLVRGEELAPKDGFLELHLTEELREVTYLDQARLSAVDHPAGTLVFPNERFCFPPFPEPHLHSLKDPLAPVRATGSDGKDWTASLAQVDDVHAVPFALEAPQFAGHAKPWFVELEFDREAVARAPTMRLAMTGWFSWSDSTANMACAGQGLEFVPPTFQVPDGQGGWKDAGPPVGFPSGKSKTMVVDVTSILPRDDPRIRVSTTLRLYWDAILLAVDADDAPREVRTLEATSARIWRRGFSAPLASGGLGRPDDSRPERFDWEHLADQPRWNQTPGMYTRYGECATLVREVDDRYAMIGAGDALTLRFDARSLPPPREGFVRDWLLYLDGWCKDADLNTVAAETVEPLPFHGMSAYPYPAGEGFPADEAHAAWRREWNTRPAYRWILPVSAAREVESLLGR